MIYEDEHEKQPVLPPPGFAQPVPNEPQPLKAHTDPERHVQKAAGGWVYIEEFVACSPSGSFWRHVGHRDGTVISVEVDHPDREVARSACMRASEILEREVPV